MSTAAIVKTRVRTLRSSKRRRRGRDVLMGCLRGAWDARCVSPIGAARGV